MECLHCDEVLSSISIYPNASNPVLSDGEEVEVGRFYSCMSRDCSHCGVVMIIPVEAKED